jgi:hypothetical protein
VHCCNNGFGYEELEWITRVLQHDFRNEDSRVIVAKEWG